MQLPRRSPVSKVGFVCNEHIINIIVSADKGDCPASLARSARSTAIGSLLAHHHVLVSMARSLSDLVQSAINMLVQRLPDTSGITLGGELTYCPCILSFTISSLVAANSAGLHPSSTGSFIKGLTAFTPSFPFVP